MTAEKRKLFFLYFLLPRPFTALGPVQNCA
jgi:hypothetical protein